LLLIAGLRPKIGPHFGGRMATISKELCLKLALGGLALSGVLISASSHAATGAPGSASFQAPFFSGVDSFQRLKDASDAIYSDGSVKTLLKSDVAHSLALSQRVTAPEVETTKFQHFFKGIEVIGSVSFHHLGAAGSQIRNQLALFDLNLTPTVSVEDAVQLARGMVGDRLVDTVPELKILPSFGQAHARLIYWIGLEENELEGGRDILVDAHSGQVIADMPRDLTLAPIQVYSTRGTANIRMSGPIGGKGMGYQIHAEGLSPFRETSFVSGSCQVVDAKSGAPLSINLSACAHVVVNSRKTAQADASALKAATNSRAVLAYFKNTHNRDSYDNRGSDVVSLVHIGAKFSNAFWSSDKKMMAYGDGDGLEFRDFTSALDVAGHEMTHGVTSETAKLIYMDESGALSEAFSDIFGKMIANDGTWVMGKKLFTDPNSKGIRDLANPGNLTVDAGDGIEKPYPAHMRDRFPSSGSCGRSNDNCWVHVNATIPGHAAYLVAKAIGNRKTEKLYYLVLTQYLHQQSSFVSAAAATLDACKQLYDRSTCEKVDGAFAQVGL